MIKNRRAKRMLSLSLLILGGILILLVPEDPWFGAILLALGLGMELAGLIIRRDG